MTPSSSSSGSADAGWQFGIRHPQAKDVNGRFQAHHRSTGDSPRIQRLAYTTSARRWQSGRTVAPGKGSAGLATSVSIATVGARAARRNRIPGRDAKRRGWAGCG